MAQVQFIQAKLATAGGQQTSGPAAAADQYTVIGDGASELFYAQATKVLIPFTTATYFPNSSHGGCLAGQVLYVPTPGGGIEKAIATALATALAIAVAV